MAGEGNQLKWRGIRNISPLENIQTQVSKFQTTVAGVTRSQQLHSAAATAAEVIIYTVPAGKTFHLVSCSCGVYTGAQSLAYINVRDGADATQYILIPCFVQAAGESVLSQTFPMPLIVPAAWDITIAVTAGFSAGSIQGWIEDA